MLFTKSWAAKANAALPIPSPAANPPKSYPNSESTINAPVVYTRTFNNFDMNAFSASFPLNFVAFPSF